MRLKPSISGGGAVASTSFGGDVRPEAASKRRCMAERRRGADVGSEYLRRGMTPREHEALASRSSTGIPYPIGRRSSRRSQLGDEARTIVDLQVCLWSEERWCGWLGLIRRADLHRGSSAIAGNPALDQPLRMGQPLSEGGRGLVDWYTGGLLACDVTQDGVDHACCPRLAADARQLHALVEGGMGRNAVKMKKLEDAKTQNDDQRIRKSLIGLLQQRLNARIQRDLPAQRTHDQRGGQVAILGRKLRSMRPVEEIIAMPLVGGNEREDLKGGKARR